MTKVYPVVITPTARGNYVVYVPDLEINTQGKSLADALFMARDAICSWAMVEQDAGRPIPEPSAAEPARQDTDLVSWVDVDFEKYRRESDMASERANVTLPRYLKHMAREAGLNLSQELQTRLKEVLNVTSA